MNRSLVDDAIALSGVLAEAGVQTIEYREAGAGWKSLSARVTDLPGLIAQAQDGAELRWSAGGARIGQGKLNWWGVPALPPRPD